MCCPLLLSYSLSASYRRSKESGAPLSLHNHTPEIMNNQMGEEGVLYWQQVYFDPQSSVEASINNSVIVRTCTLKFEVLVATINRV